LWENSANNKLTAFKSLIIEGRPTKATFSPVHIFQGAILSSLFCRRLFVSGTQIAQ